MAPFVHRYIGGLESWSSRMWSAARRSAPALLVFIAMWVTGVFALMVIVGFQARVDTQRRAEVVVETLQRQTGNLISVAFAPATSAVEGGTTPAQTKLEMAAAKAEIDTSVAAISSLGDHREAARLDTLNQRFLISINEIATLVARGSGYQAASRYGRDSLPSGSYGKLLSELHRASENYAANAARSRLIASIATVAALALLLAAFSMALYRSARLAREKQQLLERSRIEAVTDALTGLPNRRKLFADMEAVLARSAPPEEFALGMFDLDGFKAYNDTFGHPAGDALLARCGRKLAAAVEGKGSAYRIGGDEFCVIVHGSENERLLAAAAEALSEHGEYFDVRCSRGSVLIASNETTFEEALQQADQRLYNNKRSKTKGGEAHEVLLRVLAGHDASLATHANNVGALADALAQKLKLSDDEVMLTKLTAELHDVGKTAIPEAILKKPGPLNVEEWALIRQHTIIAERILAAAPALARTASLVRATHERVDGTGYPDGLRGDQIPLISRIVAIVDAYDAMTSDRPYSRVFTSREALAEIRRCSRSQFDPTIVEAFTSMMGDAADTRPAYRPAGQTWPVAAPT
ncbi:MAG: bifunctional diguanylate cyclase/phosphohydrolase [Gaiellaceae bacterium]